MGWTSVGNIKGPTGATGNTGSTGSQGIQGIQGIQGPAGTPATVPSIASKTADQAMTSTTASDVTDLAYTVATTGKYYFKVYATCTATGTAPTAIWTITGPTAGPISYAVTCQTAAVGTAVTQKAAGWATNTGTQAIPAATTVAVEIIGYANITATGILKVQLKAGGTTPSITVKASSVLIVDKLS